MSNPPGPVGVATILRNHGVASVLVVEDDEILREGVIDFVEAEGYSVVGVQNGRDALMYLESVPLSPKLILLDLMMPIMDGWELLNLLRQSARFATIPLVIMSAQRSRVPDPSFAVRIMEKPIDLDVFIEVLRETCGPAEVAPKSR